MKQEERPRFLINNLNQSTGNKMLIYRRFVALFVLLVIRSPPDAFIAENLLKKRGEPYDDRKIKKVF